MGAKTEKVIKFVHLNKEITNIFTKPLKDLINTTNDEYYNLYRLHVNLRRS